MAEEFSSQVLDELKKLNKRMGGLEADNKVLSEGQKGIRREMDIRFTEMNTRFTGLENEVHKIHDQTVRVSEFESPITDVQERLGHCELDIEVLKKQLTKS